MVKEHIFETQPNIFEKHFREDFHKAENLLLLAESRKVFHTGDIEIPVFQISKIHSRLLKNYVNRIVTIDFEGKFKDVIDHIVSHVVVSEVKDMKPDKSDALFSEFTPVVKRRKASITNVIFLKKGTPLSEVLMVVDYFKGSAPEKINTKKAENQIAKILMQQFTKKNPRSVTGLLMNGPKNTYVLVAFHMDYGKESFGFKKTRLIYKEKVGLAHEDEDHKI